MLCFKIVIINHKIINVSFEIWICWSTISNVTCLSVRLYNCSWRILIINFYPLSINCQYIWFHRHWKHVPGILSINFIDVALQICIYFEIHYRVLLINRYFLYLCRGFAIKKIKICHYFSFIIKLLVKLFDFSLKRIF